MAEHNSEVGAPEPQEPTALGLAAPQWIALAMLLVILVMIWKRVPADVSVPNELELVASGALWPRAAVVRSPAILACTSESSTPAKLRWTSCGECRAARLRWRSWPWRRRCCCTS